MNAKYLIFVCFAVLVSGCGRFEKRMNRLKLDAAEQFRCPPSQVLIEQSDNHDKEVWQVLACGKPASFFESCAKVQVGGVAETVNYTNDPRFATTQIEPVYAKQCHWVQVKQ